MKSNQLFGVARATSIAVAISMATTVSYGQETAEDPSAIALDQERDFSEPQFVLSGFELEGATLIPRRKLYQLLEPFVNQPLSFSDLRLATSALERAHALAGYEVVRVLIPEQDVQPNGVLRLLIVDAKLNEVLVDGANLFDEQWILQQLVSLRESEVINTRKMDRDIRLLSSNPALDSRVSLEPSFEPRKVDAIVKIAEQPTEAYYLTLDNTGSNSTGDFRTGLVYQNNNVAQKGHQLVGQFVTSPGHWSDVKVFNVGYKIPVAAVNTLFEVSYTDSSVNAGSLAVGGGSLSVQGSGNNLSFKAAHFLDRVAGYDTRLLASMEFKRFDSEVLLNGVAGSLVPDVSSRPLGIGLRLRSVDTPFQQDFRVMYHKNMFEGGNNSQASYSAVNPNSRVGFDVVRINFSLSDFIYQDWRYKAVLDWQYSDDSLVSGEQFGAGGVYSVRGFDERAISADSGHRLAFEVQTGNYWKWSDEYVKSLSFVGFVEGASLRLSQTPGGVPIEPHIASFGAGVRLLLAPTQQIRLDMARVISGLPTQPHGDWMLHFSYVTAL